MITVMQACPRTAFPALEIHVWEKFIKPEG